MFLVLLAVVGGLINGESNTTALLPPRLATNSSQHVSSTSLYCNSSTMTGHWEYGTNESTDFSKCKVERWCKTNDKIHVQIDRQMINYACSSYRRATYIPPPHCSLLSTAESLSVLKLNLRPGSFVFVGDSLMLQQVSVYYIYILYFLEDWCWQSQSLCYTHFVYLCSRHVM